MGQLLASEQCQVTPSDDFDHWKAQTTTALSLCTKESLDSSVMASFVIQRILMKGLHINDSLLVVMTLPHS
jgi:hypothetical protein